MNLILNANKFSLSDIIIADKKRNVVIDGSFSKIIYSNENVALSGPHINIPFITLKIVKCENEWFLQYNSSDPTNQLIIQDFSKIEYQLLDYYQKVNNLRSNISNTITKRLQSGKFKISNINNVDLNENIKIVAKISGIWETLHEVGLAVKIVHAQTIGLSVY
jgi:hypothetical protein